MGKIQADIVVFLHTRNRPDFLARALSNFREISTAPIIILDASDSPFYEEVLRQVEDVKDQIGSLYLLHHGQEASISERFHDGLSISDSRMIYLMADDDLVLSGFPALANYLTLNPCAVAAYGDTFSFQIKEGFQPYGSLEFFHEAKPNPEAAWLEDESVRDRLNELRRRPLSTLGWYAVHRRDAFEDLVSISQSNKCSSLDFEFILNVIQPILGKVVKIQKPCLARQSNQLAFLRIGERIVNYQEFSAPLVEVAVDLLVIRYGFDHEEARKLIHETLEMDRLEMESFSWRRIKVVNLLLGKFQFLNSLVALLRRKAQNRFTAADFRFEPASVDSIQSAISFVLKYITHRE
jgi:glycosyltransferase domain-containing protein